MSNLILIGCCDAKLEGTHPAHQLYQSQLFKKSMAYAETLRYTRVISWAILSAKHGIVFPLDKIANYDTRLTAATRDAWAKKVTQQLEPWRKLDRTITVLAGADYCTWIEGFKVKLPLKGLGIGQRLKWLNENTPSLSWRQRGLLNPPRTKTFSGPTNHTKPLILIGQTEMF